MSNFLEDSSYQLVGMLIVMGALGLLALTVSFLGRLLRALPSPAAPAVEAVPPAGEPAIDRAVLAAIAAAVAAVIPRRHQIVRIKFGADAQQAWSAEGRRAIYESHKIR